MSDLTSARWTWWTRLRLFLASRKNREAVTMWMLSAFGASAAGAIVIFLLHRDIDRAFVVLVSLFLGQCLGKLTATWWKKRQQDVLRGRALEMAGMNLALQRRVLETDEAFRTRILSRQRIDLGMPKPAERNEDNRPAGVTRDEWYGTAGCTHCGHEWIPYALVERCPQCGLRPVLSETAHQRLSPYLARGKTKPSDRPS